MRTGPTVALCLGLLVSLTSCGGEDTAEPAAAPSSAASAAAEQSAPAGSGGMTLTGLVGTADDPDAFEISMADGMGKPVDSVPAGTYTIQVKDPSKIHNFHLKGKGVDETTTVPEVTDTSFEVTLQPGEYTYICDPHPRMVGTLKVT